MYAFCFKLFLVVKYVCIYACVNGVRVFMLFLSKEKSHPIFAVKLSLQPRYGFGGGASLSRKQNWW
jgi:hypothetical protein